MKGVLRLIQLFTSERKNCTAIESNWRLEAIGIRETIPTH